MSELLLFNANSAIFQLFHGENLLIVNSEEKLENKTVFVRQ